MATFTSSPFSLSLEDLIKVTVSAYNSIGYSTTSSYNTGGAYVEIVPSAPSGLTLTSTSSTSIQVDWSTLTGTSTGGSAITSYNLYWDNNSGTPSISLLDSLVTTDTITGLTAGNTYIFKVRAKNIYGPGPFSSSVSITVSAVPNTMT
jgi:hypothetical protein